MPNDPAIGGASTVLLENVQTLRSVDATRAVLEERLQPGGELLIDCARVDEADLSFVQVLLSARRTADRLGATLRLARVSPVLRDVVARCGAEDDPFWNGETP